DLHLGEVVPVRTIQRVDATAGARHGGGIDRPPFEQLHLVAHAVLAHPADAAQRPLEEDRPLPHAHDEQLAPPLLGLFHPDVVVLAGGVQRLGGALDVAIPHGAAGREPAPRPAARAPTPPAAARRAAGGARGAARGGGGPVGGAGPPAPPGARASAGGAATEPPDTKKERWRTTQNRHHAHHRPAAY